MTEKRRHMRNLFKTIWKRFTSSPTQRSKVLFSANHGHPPSPSVDLQEPPGSTRDSIEHKNSNVGLIADPQKLSTTNDVASSKQQYTNQQLNIDTGSIGLVGPHSLAKPLPPRLFALIIGINEYESPNIPKLLGAVPDADAMRDYLQKHLGVPSSQIRNLRDSEATRAAIIDGIEAFSFNDEIEVGDPIMIYYAGHGGWAETPKGWKAGSTGRIELLIPYDHSSPLEDGNPKHGIPDRTLGALLSHLAGKKGDNITVILDCCHSGSGTRNYTDPTELVRGIDAGNIPSDLDQDVWTDFESSKGSERGTEVNAGFTHGGLRSHVLLAACGSEESAIEQRSRGLFTQRLLDALTTFEIDKLTYTGLLQRMPRLRQNPQCEGVNQNRIIFNAKATSKSTVYYKIRASGKGEGYVMPDVGTARGLGISLGAEFEVYQDQDFGHLLGIVVASELSPFSTTLYAKEPRFTLEGDGVALLTSAGTEEHVLRIHVADEGLKVLVKKMERTDPSHRAIQLVERDQAEFGMALEDGKVVFNIYDSDVTKYGLTRMPFNLEPTLEVISPVLRAADHFYWHLRRTPRLENDTEKGLANFVEVEVAEMEYDGTYNDDLEPVLSPAGADWKRGKYFDLQITNGGTIYGWKIINKSNVALYPALFYFDNSDWSITSYYQPPTARGIVDPPLKGHRYLPVGYGDSGSVPHIFFLREGQIVDVGTLKLFLSRKQVDLSDVAQSSPFVSIGSCRSTVPAKVKGPIKLRFLWDTILVPVVQRRADALSSY